MALLNLNLSNQERNMNRKKTTRTGLTKEQQVERDVKKLRSQYNLIKEDIIKLKDDLQKGYTIAKDFVEKGKVFTSIKNL